MRSGGFSAEWRDWPGAINFECVYVGDCERYRGFDFVWGMRCTVSLSRRPQTGSISEDLVLAQTKLPRRALAYATVTDFHTGKRCEVPYTVRGFMSSYQIARNREEGIWRALLTRTP